MIDEGIKKRKRFKKRRKMVDSKPKGSITHPLPRACPNAEDMVQQKVQL